MKKKIYFSVKIKSEFSEDFRDVLRGMSASFSESCLDEDCSVIVFKVKGDADSMKVLEKKVPLSAYASVAFTSAPF